MAGKDVYVSTVGFKSFAQFFYFQKQPQKNLYASDGDWLLNNKIDKPAFLVAKNTNREYFNEHPDCKLINEEGGFLFYQRLPDAVPN